jgi:cell division protein FtsL
VERDFIVRKQVQNRTIVREVDQDRQRELMRAGLLFLLFLAVGLFTAWQHLWARQLTMQEAGLEKERAQALEIRRHLRLEKASLRSPGRISAIATGQLHMKPATRETSTVLERVTTTPSPAPSVVATR